MFKCSISASVHLTGTIIEQVDSSISDLRTICPSGKKIKVKIVAARVGVSVTIGCHGILAIVPMALSKSRGQGPEAQKQGSGLALRGCRDFLRCYVFVLTFFCPKGTMFRVVVRRKRVLVMLISENFKYASDICRI